MKDITIEEVRNYTKFTDKFLCGRNANIYNIRFRRFKVRDIDSDFVLFEVSDDSPDEPEDKKEEIKEEIIEDEKKDIENKAQESEEEKDEKMQEEEKEEEEVEKQGPLSTEEVLSLIEDRIEEAEKKINEYNTLIEEYKTESKNKLKSGNKRAAKRLLDKCQRIEQAIELIKTGKEILVEQKYQLSEILSKKEKLKEKEEENKEIKSDIKENEEQKIKEDNIPEKELKENNEQNEIKNDPEIQNEQKLVKKINKIYQSVPLPTFNFSDDEEEKEEV